MARVQPTPVLLAGNQAPRVISSQPSTNITPASHTSLGPQAAPAPMAPQVPLQPAARPAAPPPLPPRPPPAAHAAAPALQPMQPPPAAAAPKLPAAAAAAAAASAEAVAPPKKLSVSGSVPGTPGTPTPPPPKTRRPQTSQAVTITMEQVDAPGMHEYGIHLLARSGVVVPTDCELKRRGRSFSAYNACLSPLHVIAGWSVAGLSADQKTRDFIESMIEKKALDLSVTGKAGKGRLHPSINALLNELGFPSFVRLYIEPQFAIPQIAAVVDEINNAYGGDEDAPVIKPLCFSCDDSGDATARKINHDVLIVTGKREAAVIDSNANLHRLAQACLVTVFSSTFSWALRESSSQTTLAHFYSSYERKKKFLSKVRCLTDSGSYRCSTGGLVDCVELTGLQHGVMCYLIRPRNQPIADWMVAQTGASIDAIIADLPKAKPISVSVPLFTVETPVSLGKAAAASRGCYSLWRLFDREKCKLTRIFYKNNEDSLCTLPLWDHYHMTVFELTNKLPSVGTNPSTPGSAPGTNPEDAPKTDIEQLDAFDNKPTDKRAPGGAERPAKLIYHKLDDCTQGVWAEEPRPAPPKDEGETSNMPGKLSFDTPFMFIVRKQNGKRSPLPICVGLFTNADTDSRKDVPVD